MIIKAYKKPFSIEGLFCFLAASNGIQWEALHTNINGLKVNRLAVSNPPGLKYQNRT
jgi:hypothetical protein